MTAGTQALSLASFLFVATLSSCAQLTTNSEQTSAVLHESDEQTTVATQSLTGEDMFQLLLAEIATNRREYGAAAALYSELASHYNDVTIIERAVALNQSIGNFELVTELAQKWTNLRPTEPRAFAALALGQIATGNTADSKATVDRWLTLDPQADASILLSALESLSPNQLSEMQSVLTQLQLSHKKSASLLYTRSRIAYATGQADEALSLIEQSLNLADNLQVSLFKFQILTSLEKQETAQKLIKQLYQQHPTDRHVAVQYARFLFHYDPENLADLEILYTRFATEPTIARTYARAAFEQQDYDAAQAVYQRLLTQGFADEAHYYLGRIDLVNAMSGSAVNHFEAVKGKTYLPSAIAEWLSMARSEDQSRLLQSLETGKTSHPSIAATLWRLQSNYFQLIDQPELAWQTLNDAIIQFPDDNTLLYDQAMMAAERNNYVLLENNLLAILEKDPENIDALNALGYTWADLNKNLADASAYIEKAISAEPDNPAYQDSKGWVLYRQGHLTEALTWLEKAYSQMENDEVAAHLAEVLWFLNRKEDAQAYLKTVERLNPNSKYIGTLNALFAN